MTEEKWVTTLSTTEKNSVGSVLLRKNNKNSEVMKVKLIKNSKPYDLTALKVFFVTHFSGKDGLKVPIQKEAKILNAKEGVFEFIFDEDCMQKVGRQEAYFEIYDYDKFLDATQNFTYEILSSSRIMKADFTPYIATWQEAEKMLNEGTAKVLTDKTDELHLKKADIRDVDNKLEGKTNNTTFVAMTDDLQRQIESTQSGLIGEFNSEDELKRAYPKGEKGYAIVWIKEKNENIRYSYTYKNSVWVKGNAWKDLGIPIDSISGNKLKNNELNEYKTTFFEGVHNLFDKASPEIQYNKGFISNTNNVIFDEKFNITHTINLNGIVEITILNNYNKIENVSFYKIACYDDTKWLSTMYYVGGKVKLPYNTKRILVHYDNTVDNLIIVGETPTIQKKAIKNGSIDIYKADFFDIGENLLDINSDGISFRKGFTGTSNLLVDSDPHAVTNFVDVPNGHYIYVTVDDKVPEIPSHYKIAEYDLDYTWLRTTILNSAYVELLQDTKYCRFQFNHYHENIMISIDEFKKFKPFRKTIIMKDYLPEEASNQLDGKNFSTYGDSLSARKMWQDYLVKKYNMNFTNLGIGSTTVAYVAEHESQYPCLLNQVRLDALKASNPDILTINGGANDAHRYVQIGDNAEFTKSLGNKDKTTFKGAFSYLIEYLLIWKPTLKIILITIPKVDRVKFTSNYQDFNDAIYEIAHEYGLPIADWNRECGYSHVNINDYTIDGLHHNSNGGKRAAEVVMKQLDVINL
ncbi:BppU family phage baseplate upper protein [Vagococcus fluvialis]|uniref:BppU family phage baseplate upper protein n=1 Tax=Vagococcus fluvialis TaxID=2738 RepID=UPI003B215ED2